MTLTKRQPYCYSTVLGSHNSAISLADGYGNLDPYFQQYFKWIKWVVRNSPPSLLFHCCNNGHLRKPGLFMYRGSRCCPDQNCKRSSCFLLSTARRRCPFILSAGCMPLPLTHCNICDPSSPAGQLTHTEIFRCLTLHRGTGWIVISSNTICLKRG